MPKVTAKPDYTEAQFARELKRYGFQDDGAFMGTRRFCVKSQPDGFMVRDIPGIYEGRFGNMNRRLTLKHLQNVAALHAMVNPHAHVDAPTKKNSAPRSTRKRKNAPASSEQTPLETAITNAAPSRRECQPPSNGIFPRTPWQELRGFEGMGAGNCPC